MGINSAGKKFSVLMFRNFSRVIPVVAIKKPPTIEISVMSSLLKKSADKNLAIR